LWVQLNHPGKQSPKGLNISNLSPSAVPFRSDMAAFFETPREATTAEILEIIQRFGRSAAICKKAGFSGVQIHGAHGYLISQFLSPHHNQRTDEWGGSTENRRRFVMAVYEEIRKQVGADFPIAIKLNSADFQKGGFTEEESMETIRALAEAGIESPRVLRRLQTLRRWSHEQEIKSFFTRNARTRCTHGAGTPRRVPIPLGSH
jgi:2,4-dienoyl-CoA reductase-like NADH-dependent reductase (Old Yellow Enzyme family)